VTDVRQLSKPPYFSLSNFTQREGGHGVGVRPGRVLMLDKITDLGSHGLAKLLLLGQEAFWTKAPLADTPEGPQDVSVRVGRVVVAHREGASGEEFGMDCFHRHVEHRNVNDAYERRSAVERYGRPVAIHPKFIPTINVYADGAAQNASLEQLVVAQGENPLCGESGRIEDRDTDMGNGADHDVGWMDKMREIEGCVRGWLCWL
jgi:hypothetical protein